MKKWLESLLSVNESKVSTIVIILLVVVGFSMYGYVKTGFHLDAVMDNLIMFLSGCILGGTGLTGATDIINNKINKRNAQSTNTTNEENTPNNY